MTFHSRALMPTLALFAAATVLLAGCTTGPTGTGGTDSGKSGGSASSANGPKCEDNTSGYKLYSDPSISKSPKYGQVWGDGSDFVITYDDYTDGVLSLELSYVQKNGGAIPVTGVFFPDPVGKTFTSNDPNFTSTTDGYYGIATVSITTDAGTKELGNYCVLLKLSK